MFRGVTELRQRAGLDVFGAGSNTGQQLDQRPCKNAPGTNQDFNSYWHLTERWDRT